MRATVDFHGLDEMDNNPIRVVIADGEENEVSSAGGGMGCPKNFRDELFSPEFFFAFFVSLVAGLCLGGFRYGAIPFLLFEC